MKLKTLQQEAFQLDNQQVRMPFMQFDETIREALANTLAHADYIQAYHQMAAEASGGDAQTRGHLAGGPGADDPEIRDL